MSLISKLPTSLLKYLPQSMIDNTISNIFSKGNSYPIVLCFHHVEEKESENIYSVTKNKFEEVIKYFKDNDYDFLFENEYHKVNKKSVIITLDDGYTNNYLYAYEIIKKYNIKATINLIGQFIDNPDDDHLSLDMINDMKSSNLVSFEAHSYSHLDLTKLDDKTLLYEVIEPQKALKMVLNIDSEVFVYPYVKMDYRVSNIVKNYYKYAYGQGDTTVDYLYRIPRIFIYMSDNNKSISTSILTSLLF